MEIIEQTHTVLPKLLPLLQLLMLQFIFVGIFPVYGAESLLLFRTAGTAFEEAGNSMITELQSTITVNEVIIDKNTTEKTFADKITEAHPRLVVLMSNSAIKLFKKYQKTLSDSDTPIPSVSLMGTLVDISIKGIKNACGIAYEVPIVTCLVSLRQLSKDPIKKVGIIHREFLNNYMTINKRFCSREGFEIATHVLPNKVSNPVKECNKGLKNLLKSENVDAIWVYNDNMLLKPDVLIKAWIPAVKKYKKPMIVGVEQLANPKLHLGVFAVLPDHKGLGYQAANLILDIMDDDWHVDDQMVQPPISIYTVVNQPMAEQFWKLNEDDFLSIDKVFKK